MRKRLLCLALCLLFCGMPGANALAATAMETKGTTTVLIYMTGSDLESGSAAATKDMQEIAESGVDLTTTNVILYTGGSVKWHSDVPDDANAMFRLTANGFQKVATFPQQSMGAPENLTRFLNEAYKRFPADRFDLILWDHGNGPVIGYCLDKQYENDTLTLSEMRDALEQSPFSHDNRLGFLGFDACLMASAELVCMLGDYAQYLIASQETEPNFGWNYAFLKDCGKVPLRTLACSAVDAYVAYCEEYYADKPFFHSDVTMSVIDLSYAQELKEVIGALFRTAAPDVTSRFTKIAASRVGMRAFGRTTTGSEYDLVDLKSVAEQMEQFCPDETKRLETLLERMVVYAASNTEQSCGMSLYYPFFNKTYYDSAWKAVYREMNVFPDYLSYLNRFEQTWMSEDLGDTFDNALEVTLREDGYFLPLSEEQLDVTVQARYFILRRLGEGVYAPIYIGTNVEKVDGGLLAHFDGNIICYEDSTGYRGIPGLKLTNQVGAQVDYSVIGCILEDRPFGSVDWHGQVCDFLLSVNLDSREIEVKGVYATAADASAAGKRQEMDLSEWTLLLFQELPSRYLTRAENGRIKGFLDWPVNDLFYGDELALADDIHFLTEQLYDDGYEYCLMFELMDAQDNQVCAEPFPITVEPAPPVAEPDPVETAWQEDGTAVLSIGGVTLTFTCGHEAESQRSLFMVRAENGNDFPAKVSLFDLSMNGIDLNAMNSLWFYLDAGETQIKEASGAAQLLEYTGRTGTLSMKASVWNQDNYQTLCFRQPVALTGTAPQGQPIVQPLLGALAREQALYEDDGLAVTLLGMGFYQERYALDPTADDAKLTVYLKVENRSNAKRSVLFEALRLNGAELSTGWYLISEVVGLQPHKTCYLKRTVPLRNIVNLRRGDLSNFDSCETPLITSVSAAEVLLIVDGEGMRLPIALAESGDGETIEPRGTLVYEDETWRVWRDPSSDTGNERTLWLLNRTDATLSAEVRHADDTVLWSGDVGPQSLQLIRVNAVETASVAIMHRTWADAQRWWEPSNEKTVSRTFTLGGKGGAQ